MGKITLMEEDLHIPPLSSHLTKSIFCCSPKRLWKDWARLGNGWQVLGEK